MRLFCWDLDRRYFCMMETSGRFELLVGICWQVWLQLGFCHHSRYWHRCFCRRWLWWCYGKLSSSLTDTLRSISSGILRSISSGSYEMFSTRGGSRAIFPHDRSLRVLAHARLSRKKKTSWMSLWQGGCVILPVTLSYMRFFIYDTVSMSFPLEMSSARYPEGIASGYNNRKSKRGNKTYLQKN